MSESMKWDEFESAVIATQSNMSLPEVQAMTGADTLAQALTRLISRGSFSRD